MEKIDELELRRIQLTSLQKIDTFCHENGIRYYLAYGTLLGAVRHKGYIPWDDDIDIMMPRPDYVRFINTFNGFTINNRVVSHLLDPAYPWPYAKIVDTNTVMEEHIKYAYKNMGVYVDIFPLDEVENVDVAKKLHEEKSKYFDKYRRTFKKTFFRNCVNLFIHMHIKTFLKEIYYASIGKVFKEHYFFKYKHAEDLIQKQRGQKCMCYGGFYGFEKELCEKEWFGKGVAVPFEDFSIIVPSNYHAYLTRFYNDYMIPPPPQYRESHHSRYFVDLDRRWDIEDVLKMKPQKSHKIVRRYES